MDVKWIKIVTDLFDDEKILLLESMPEADSLIVIWIKLLCLAGKQNNSGVFLINESIPYTDEMLATIMRRPINTVRLALSQFQQYGMIEFVNGVITIPNWGKHQSLEQMENRKEYQKNYQREYRKRQRLLAEADNKCLCEPLHKHLCKDDVNTPDIEEDKEKRIILDNSITANKDLQAVVEAWNKIDGIGEIKKLNENSTRCKLLKARIKDYGVDGVLHAIENIKNSKFLLGGGESGWVITFDWFVKPNNFPKVHDGNYNDKQRAGSAEIPKAAQLGRGRAEDDPETLKARIKALDNLF